MIKFLEELGIVGEKIDPNYDARAGKLHEILSSSKNDLWKCIDLCFKYGYMQGCKATLAKQKKKAQVNRNA